MTPDNQAPALGIVDRVREFARLHGWAIGAHGSMDRDIDLIAVPWTTEATPYAAFVGALERVIGVEQFGGVSGKPHCRWGILFKKPGARMAGSVFRGEHCFKSIFEPMLLDISFIDPRESCAECTCCGKATP